MTWLIDYHNVFTFNLGLQQYDQFRRFSFIFVSFSLSPFVILYKYQGIKLTFQGQKIFMNMLPLVIFLKV